MTSTKHTPQTSKKSHLYFIWDYIQKYNRLPKHMYSNQLLNYYTSQLRKKGYIIKKGYGVWETIKQYTNTHHVGKNIRGHGYHITVRIPKIKNWDKREDFLKSSSIIYKAIPQGQRLLVKGHKVWLCSNSIVIYYPRGLSFFDYTAEKAESEALWHCEKIIRLIEAKISCKVSFQGKYHIRISKNHYGKVKDELAKICNDTKQKIHCYLNNENWLVIDHSEHKDEIETVHPKSAVPDMDKFLVPFLNDAKEYYDKTGEVPLLSNLIKAHWMYAQNVESHIEAIKELGKQVRRLVDKIDQM